MPLISRPFDLYPTFIILYKTGVNSDMHNFLNCAQYIDCGSFLAVLTSTRNICLEPKYET